MCAFIYDVNSNISKLVWFKIKTKLSDKAAVVQVVTGIQRSLVWTPALNTSMCPWARSSTPKALELRLWCTNVCDWLFQMSMWHLVTSYTPQGCKCKLMVKDKTNTVLMQSSNHSNVHKNYIKLKTAKTLLPLMFSLDLYQTSGEHNLIWRWHPNGLSSINRSTSCELEQKCLLSPNMRYNTLRNDSALGGNTTRGVIPDAANEGWNDRKRLKDHPPCQ